MVDRQKILASDLQLAELLAPLLLVRGERLPSVSGKASNKSKRLGKLIGPNRKLDLSKDSEGIRKLLQHEDEQIRNIAKARLAVKSWPLHQKRVSNLINYAKVRDGKIGIPVSYCGAHTHRNSGTEGINMYNLPKRPKKGYELLNEIKTLITAPKGFTLLTFDFAQIEARYLAFMAEQWDLVGAFAQGRDVYSEFATVLFRRKVRKPVKTDPPPVNSRLELHRNCGKMNILADGYGLGAKTSYARCMENEELREFVTPEIAQEFITTYRSTYPKIPRLWKDVETAFKFVFKYKHEVWKLHGLEIRWDEKYARMIVTLPSGSKLYYPEVEECSGGYGKSLKWKYSKGLSFWGGAMVENIIQSVCRDLLVFAMRNLLDKDYRIVADLYDSVTILLPGDKTDEIETVKQIVTVTPPWCEGLPLAVDMEISKHL